MVPNVLHIARVWVRCVKGSATVALVVSSLPETARIPDGNSVRSTPDIKTRWLTYQDKQVTLEHYDALQNISFWGGGAKNVLRCQLAPSATDASEAVSEWTQLEVAVRSSKPAHEVVVQVVVQSETDGAAILMDDASLEAGAHLTLVHVNGFRGT